MEIATFSTPAAWGGDSLSLSLLRGWLLECSLTSIRDRGRVFGIRLVFGIRGRVVGILLLQVLDRAVRHGRPEDAVGLP